MLMAAVVAAAKPVPQDVALRVAQTYLAARGMHNTAALTDVSDQTPYRLIYTFVAPDGGFALVSADDCVRPILGYSATGRFGYKDVPEHIAAWLEDYEREIAWWQSRQASPNPAVEAEWAMLAVGEMPPMPLTTAVNQLMTTTWNQAPYYNIMCPVDERHWSGHPYAGCVATAMSQIMKYWNYPQTGYASYIYEHPTTDDTSYGLIEADFGATAYQWASMPDQLTYASSGAEDTAVATLMFHCGVAVNMKYGINGSGAQTVNFGNVYQPNAENALIYYFKYSSSLHSIYRESFSLDEWNSRLRAEIDASRPILYSGSDVSGGHAFVLDGYNDDSYFHVNWGWDGSCDGYYPIGGLNPSASGYGGNSTSSYNNNNKAIVGIQPNPNWGNGGTITASASDATHGGVNIGDGGYAFGDYFTIQPYVNPGYRFLHWSDGYPFYSRTVYTNGGDYTFTAVLDTVGSDTIAFCSGSYYLTGFGNPSNGEISWGIKIDRSLLATGRELHAVQHYIAYDGDYDLKVYVGNNNPDFLIYDTTVTYSEEQLDQWQTIPLNIPVVNNGMEDLYITFHKTSDSYPAICTFYSGVNESLCFPFSPSGDYYGQYSFLIRGLFRNTTAQPVPHVSVSSVEQVSVDTAAHFEATTTEGATVTWLADDGATATGHSADFSFSTPGEHQVTATATHEGQQSSASWYLTVVDYNESDTVSYCLDRRYRTNVGELSGTTTWGIRLPSDYLAHRDSLVDALLYIVSEGEYILRVYNGPVIATENLVYTNTYTIQGFINEYAHLTPDSAVAIDRSKDLWLIFETTAPYPAAGCIYLGDPNSDYYYDTDEGGGWGHITQIAPSLSKSWLIKAVTVEGPEYYAITALGNDTTMGIVVGGGIYTVGDSVRLTAMPASGYHFVEWQDGNTQNPRTVTVTGNATYVATFEAIPPTQYTVSLNIGWLYGYAPGYYDTNYVYVTGAGTYVEGTEVTITASWGMADYICFVSWVTDEGDTLQGETYTFTVTRDISFTALYTGCGGIEDISGSVMSLNPNPATEAVTVSGLKAGTLVRLIDMAGKECVAATAKGEKLTIDLSHLPAGLYFLHAISGESQTTLKIVKQ